jgi:hypothetical protein
VRADDGVVGVNKLVIDVLDSRSGQASCARALAELPGATKVLQFLKPPAEKAFGALAGTLLSVDPHAPTACAGWSVHELTAHLAAGSAEIADLIERELAEGRTRPTRGFEEREAPYRALSPKKLRRAFFAEALRDVDPAHRKRAGTSSLGYHGFRRGQHGGVE